MKNRWKYCTAAFLLAVLLLLSSCSNGNKPGENDPGKTETGEFDVEAAPENPDYDLEDPLGILGEFKGMDMIRMAMDGQISPESIFPLYEKALSMVEMPDDTLKSQINDEFTAGKDYWMRIDETGMKNGLRCYGIYSGRAILFRNGFLTVETTKTIAGVDFYHSEDFFLNVYSSEGLYNLEEAYEKNIVSAKDVAVAAEIHKIIEAYYWASKKWTGGA